MNNTTSHPNGGDAATTSTYNVICVSFDADTNAYAALTSLKQLDAHNRSEAVARARELGLLAPGRAGR